MAIRHAARHYTPEGKLHKGNRSRSLGANSPEPKKSDTSEKRIQEIKISNCDAERSCV
jgi:hypothetical protein